MIYIYTILIHIYIYILYITILIHIYVYIHHFSRQPITICFFSAQPAPFPCSTHGVLQTARMLGHPQEHGQGGAIRTGTPDQGMLRLSKQRRRFGVKNHFGIDPRRLRTCVVCVASNELFQMYIYIICMYNSKES